MQEVHIKEANAFVILAGSDSGGAVSLFCDSGVLTGK